MIANHTKSSTKRQFRSIRGRPRKTESTPSNAPDLGTPELILKRAGNSTTEAIDLCLERQLISENLHSCALHFRWLHTIRYGAPGVTALDLTRGNGMEIHAEDDPSWRRHREQDYHEAIMLLRQKRYDKELIPCIIYNERPDFLNLAQYQAALRSHTKIDSLHRSIARFNEGLELLAEYWERRIK